MNDIKYFIDAIKGACLNRTFCAKYIPKKYIVVSNNGDNLTFNVKKFVNDWSNENTINESTLKALHKIITGDDVAVSLYNNFEPRCPIQILFDKCEDEYVKKRIDTYLEIESKKGLEDALSCEVGDYINFGILHGLGCENKEIKKVLVENGILDERCFITKEKMEKLNEKLKTEKLFNTITQLTQMSEEENIGKTNDDYCIKDVNYDEETNTVDVFCTITRGIDKIDITITPKEPSND